MRNSEHLDKLSEYEPVECENIGVIVELGGQDLPYGHNQVIIGYYDESGNKSTIETRDNKIMNDGREIGDVIEFDLDDNGNFDFGCPA